MATLKVTSTLDPSGFNKGVDGMKRKAKEVTGSGGGMFGGGGFGGFGGLVGGVTLGNLLSKGIVAAFQVVKNAIRDSAVGLVELSKEARNLGTTAPELNTFKDTLEQFGIEGDKAATVFERIIMARDEAVEGNAKAIESFKKLGLSVSEMAGMTSQQLVERTISAYSSGGPSGEGDTALGEIVGKRGMIGARYGLKQYGKGERRDYAFEPNQDTADTMLAAENMRRSFWEGAKNLLGGITASTLSTFMPLTEEKSRIREQRQKEAEEEKRANIRAARLAKERREAEAAEKVAKQRNAIMADYADRISEATQGITPATMGTDIYGRMGIGLGAGGGTPDMMAYQASIRQAQATDLTNKLLAEQGKKLDKLNKTLEEGGLQ